MSTYRRTARGVNRRQIPLDSQEEDARTKAIQENFRRKDTQPEKGGDRKLYRGKSPRNVTLDKSQEQQIWVEHMDTMEICVKALKSLVDEAK